MNIPAWFALYAIMFACIGQGFHNMGVTNRRKLLTNFLAGVGYITSLFMLIVVADMLQIIKLFAFTDKELEYLDTAGLSVASLLFISYYAIKSKHTN